jgi:hypothetical protein
MSQGAGSPELTMKKISSFMTELLPCGARWEYEDIWPADTIALHRLPAYWPNVNVLPTSTAPLLLRA